MKLDLIQSSKRATSQYNPFTMFTEAELHIKKLPKQFLPLSGFCMMSLSLRFNSIGSFTDYVISSSSIKVKMKHLNMQI